MDMDRGENVVLTHTHAGAKKGTKGKIHSTHKGTFYGVAVPGGIAFVPHSMVASDPDNDGDNDSPGSGGDTDADAPAT